MATENDREQSSYEKRAEELHAAQMGEAADIRVKRATEELRREERIAMDRKQREDDAKRFAIYVDEVAHLKDHRDRVDVAYEAMVEQSKRNADALFKQAEALDMISQRMPR